MGACATKPKVLKEGGNAPETREIVKASGDATGGEEGESKSRRSLEILLKEVGNESETKEDAIVKVKHSVEVVEQAKESEPAEAVLEKGAAIEKEEANNADIATLEKTVESPVSRVVDVGQDC